MRARSTTAGPPSMSLPIAMGRRALDLRNMSSATISLRKTFSRALFGTSMPTAALPGMGATMRTRSASSDMARSSERLAILATRVPGAGANSYIVTTGPGRMATTSPFTP